LSHLVREAREADVAAIQGLLPRLASFPIPSRREPEHLWRGDEALLLSWARGEVPTCLVHVAEDESGSIVGVTIVSLRGELLSGDPSAHLEVLAVSQGSEGRGIGTSLMAAAEAAAIERGATSMTLHVFASNERARLLYERLGYDGELMRYIKDLA